MKVRTDANKIVLTELPLLQWLAGLVFLMAGLQVVSQNLLAGPDSSIFGILFGSVFVYAGYAAGMAVSYQKITIDRWLKTITVRKIGLFNIKKLEYPAADIEKLYCETETDSENEKYYTICMSLKTGQSLVLGTQFRSRTECETVIKTAVTFLEQMSFPNQYQPKYL